MADLTGILSDDPKHQNETKSEKDSSKVQELLGEDSKKSSASK
jgi:uncharacterized protein YjbJ (UPF0337 family)